MLQTGTPTLVRYKNKNTHTHTHTHTHDIAHSVRTSTSLQIYCVWAECRRFQIMTQVSRSVVHPLVLYCSSISYSLSHSVSLAHFRSLALLSLLSPSICAPLSLSLDLHRAYTPYPLRSLLPVSMPINCVPQSVSFCRLRHQFGKLRFIALAPKLWSENRN